MSETIKNITTPQESKEQPEIKFEVVPGIKNDEGEIAAFFVESNSRKLDSDIRVLGGDEALDYYTNSMDPERSEQTMRKAAEGLRDQLNDPETLKKILELIKRKEDIKSRIQKLEDQLDSLGGEYHSIVNKYGD